MRKLVLAGVLVVALPTLSAAALCVPDSLANYIGAPPCEIGGATFSNFDAPPLFSFATPIAPADIFVEPLGAGVGLDFVLHQSAAAGEQFESLIRYTISNFVFGTALLAMTGASATDVGSVSAVEDVCGDGTYASSSPNPADCSSGKVTTLAVVQDAFGSTSPDQQPVDPMFADVFVNIVIDGGPIGGGGAASLDGKVRNAFATAVPEPSIILMIAPAFGVLLARRRSRSRRG
jgi:hypothetical protein